MKQCEDSCSLGDLLICRRRCIQGHIETVLLHARPIFCDVSNPWDPWWLLSVFLFGDNSNQVISRSSNFYKARGLKWRPLTNEIDHTTAISAMNAFPVCPPTDCKAYFSLTITRQELEFSSGPPTATWNTQSSNPPAAFLT